MSLSELIEQIFGSKKDDTPQEEEEPPQCSVKLIGPFLSEDFALHHYKELKDNLKRTFCNIKLHIYRQLTILSDDYALVSRDNGCKELGIEPHRHKLGLSICKNEYRVCSVDEIILLNDDDVINITRAISIYPPSKAELEQLNKHKS